MLSKAFVDSCKSFSLKTCLGHIQPDDFPVPKLLMCLAAMRSKHIGITLRSFKGDLMNQFITVQLRAHTQWTHSVDFQLDQRYDSTRLKVTSIHKFSCHARPSTSLQRQEVCTTKLTVDTSGRFATSRLSSSSPSTVFEACVV